MKPKILATCIAVLLLSAINADSLAGVNDSRDKGISGSQLRDIADSLPPSTATIEAIQFLRTDNSIDRAAILMYGETTRWQIFVFRRQPNGKFALEWNSAKLVDLFAESSADQFQPYNSFGEQTFKFSGCAPHNCPDVFSVLLYIPSKSMAIAATYTLGKITYSPPAVGGQGYQIYRNYLDKLIAKQRTVAN